MEAPRTARASSRQGAAAVAGRAWGLPWPIRSRRYGPEQKWAWSIRKSLLIHSAVVLASLALLYLANSSVTLAVSGMLVSVTYPVLGWVEARRSPVWLTPISVYLFWSSLGLGWGAIYIGSVVSGGAWLTFLKANIPPGDLAKGYVIAMIGSLAMHAGLHAFRPAQSPRTAVPATPSSRLLLIQLAVLWTAGSMILARPAYLGSVGAIGGVLEWGAFAALLSLATTAPALFRISPAQHLGCIVIGSLGLLATTINAQFGYKAYMMLAFSPMLVFLLRRQDLRKWVLPFALMLSFIYLGAIAPAVNGSRALPRRPNQRPAERVLQGFKLYSPLYTGQLEWKFYQEQSERFLARVFESAPVGYFVGDVRQNGLRWGSTMSNLAYAFIPRAFWPEKPIVNRGTWFTAYLGAAAREEEATTSTGLDSSGELYWNFGMPGVVLGMLALGSLYSVLWRIAGPDPRAQALSMLLHTVASYKVCWFGSEASSMAVFAISTGMIFGVLVWVQRFLQSQRTYQSPLPVRPRPVPPMPAPLRRTEGR